MKSTINDQEANAIISGALNIRRPRHSDNFGKSPGSAEIDFDDEEEELPPPPATFFHRHGHGDERFEQEVVCPTPPPHRGAAYKKVVTTTTTTMASRSTSSSPAPTFKRFHAPEIPPPLPATPAPRLSADTLELETYGSNVDADADKEDDVFVTPKRRAPSHDHQEFVTPKSSRVIPRDSVVLKNLQKKGGIRDLVNRFEGSTSITYDRNSDKYNLSFQRNFANHRQDGSSSSSSPIRRPVVEKFEHRLSIWKSTTEEVEQSEVESIGSDMDIVSVRGFIRSPSREKEKTDRRAPRLPSIDLESEKQFGSANALMHDQQEPSPPMVSPIRRHRSDMDEDTRSVNTYLNPRKLSLSQFSTAPPLTSTPYNSRMQPVTPKNPPASASSSVTTAIGQQTTPKSRKGSQNSRFTFGTPNPIVWSTNGGTPVGNSSFNRADDEDTLSAKFRSSWGMKKETTRPHSPVTWHNNNYGHDGGLHRVNSRKENRSFQSESPSLGIPVQYTMSLASIPTPPMAIRVSSQRRLPYNTDSMRLLAADSPLSTPRRISVNSHSMSHWTPRRLDLDDSIVSYETTNEYVPESDFLRFVERLRSKVRSEEKHIREARTNVAFFRRTDTKYSMNEFCAHALVLISERRLTIYRDLIERINTFLRMQIGPPPVVVSVRSVFTIFNMRLALARDFYLRNKGDDTPYVFLAVGSTTEKVIATQVMDVNETGCIRARHVAFDDVLCFKNLPICFVIHVDFYAFKLTPRHSRTPKAIAKKAIKFLGSAVKSPSSSTTNLNTSAHSKGSSRFEDDESHGFVNIGQIVLTRFTQGQVNVGVANCQYPIDPTVSLSCKCSPLPEKLNHEVVGVWTLVSAQRRIQMYHIRMIHGVIHMFHGPEDSINTTVPVCAIDVSAICDKSVERFESNDPNYQHMFQFDLLSFPRQAEKCEHKRYLIAVESLDALRMWLTAINTTLGVIRGTEV